MQLGRYLGPSADIGPAMTAQILKQNGKVVHQSTFRHLTEDELASTVEIEARKAFDTNIHKKLGEPALEKDLDPKVDSDMITPTYNLYKDDNGDGFG